MVKRKAGVVNVDQRLLAPRLRSVACANGIVDTASLVYSYYLSRVMPGYQVQMLDQIYHGIRAILSSDPLTTQWRLTCAGTNTANNTRKRARH